MFGTFFVPLAVVVLIVLWVVLTYNRLVVLRNRIREAESGIDVQLKRRADLIPNLVETVKGYAKHEREVFENVTKARAALMKAETPKKEGEADNVLTGALKSLFAVAENYPELKANENFQELQRQLEDTEDKVAYSRQFYNGNVLDYNNKLEVFPSNVMAGMFNFKPFEFFEAEAEAKKEVEVKF
jgi:LemA protein